MGAPRFWQFGLVVPDIAAAAEELERALPVSFAERRDLTLGPHRLRAQFGGPGPPYVELLEGEPGGPWDSGGRPSLDHLGYWVDDLAAERARLEAEGFPNTVDGDELGMSAHYHVLPKTKRRIEPIDSGRRDALRRAYGLDELDGWDARAPLRVAFAVDDLDAARDELTRALGLYWRPVEETAEGHRSALSEEGPPHVQLVDGGDDHLTYAADAGARAGAVGPATGIAVEVLH